MTLVDVYKAAWDAYLDGPDRGEVRTMYGRAHEHALEQVAAHARLFLSATQHDTSTNEGGHRG